MRLLNLLIVNFCDNKSSVITASQHINFVARVDCFHTTDDTGTHFFLRSAHVIPELHEPHALSKSGAVKPSSKSG
jgi:hypothetical protein